MRKPVMLGLGATALAAILLAAPALTQQNGPKRVTVPGSGQPPSEQPSGEAAAPSAETSGEAGSAAAEESPADEGAAESGSADNGGSLEIFPEGESVDATARGAAEGGTAEAPASEVFPEGEVVDQNAAGEPSIDATDVEQGAVTTTGEEGNTPFVGDYTLGDPAAPVQVIEYASFTCPHCAAYHEAAWSDLKENYIEPGKIGFTFREVYFDRFGLWASMTARCGGERAFYPMIDQLLKKQDEWTKADGIAEAITRIGRLAGLTDAQMKACLENEDFARLLVDEYRNNATADEVESTPTFIITGPNGEQTVNGNDPDAVRKAIEDALAAG